MAIISRPYGLLFIMAPRTGCTAIGNLLCDRLHGEYLPKSDVLDSRGFAVLRHKHNTLRELFEHGLLTPQEKARLFTFTCVRNPFDSLVSLYIKLSTTYRDLLQDKDAFIHRIPGYIDEMNWCRTHSFDEWLERRYAPRPVARFFKLRRRKSMFARYTDGADYVMRFERLQEGFDAVLRQVHLESVEIPFFNATPDRVSDYRTYYSPRSRCLIEHVFSDDLKRYGYRF
jgi:Sulfotransferase family